MKGLIISLFTLTFSTGCSVFGLRSEETPKYDVIKKSENFEIRKYQPYIVAETTVEGDFKSAQSEAFRILAGYIFGKNRANQNIPMTAPVSQNKAPQKSETIAMTAPVSQIKATKGWTMAFMMPESYKLEELPDPIDDRIKFRQIPEKHVAVLRFSWGRGQEKFQAKAAELAEWIKQIPEFETTSSPTWAGYDPPWTLPFARRNEVMYDLKPSN